MPCPGAPGPEQLQRDLKKERNIEDHFSAGGEEIGAKEKMEPTA